ncbi:MAG: DegV family protein [Chloroflexota bacterium]
MLRIAIDASADMPPDWIEKYDLSILPIPIQIGGMTYYQGLDITNAQFYKLVQDKSMFPKTAAPSPSKISQIFESIYKAGDSILALTVSRKMSAMYDMVVDAAKQLEKKVKVHVFDSGGGSALLGFMGKEARLLDKAGKSLKEIQTRLEEIRDRAALVFTVNKLEFARCSGRVSTLQAGLGSLLNIKPIIVLREGLLSVAENVRTRKKSLDRIIEVLKNQVHDRRVNVAVVHADDPGTAELLKERICRILNCAEVVVTDLSLALAVHFGPGTVGIVAYPVDA